MEFSDWSTREVELAVRSALLDCGIRQATATGEGFTVYTLLADVFRAGEGVVVISHVPSAKATLAQISAYQAALDAHPVGRYLWIHVVPVGPVPEFRLWTGYGSRLWLDGDEVLDTQKAS